MQGFALPTLEWDLMLFCLFLVRSSTSTAAHRVISAPSRPVPPRNGGGPTARRVPGRPVPLHGARGGGYAPLAPPASALRGVAGAPWRRSAVVAPRCIARCVRRPAAAVLPHPRTPAPPAQNKVGGGEGCEGCYGTLTRAGAQRIFAELAAAAGLGPASVLIDVGAGIGRCARLRSGPAAARARRARGAAPQARHPPPPPPAGRCCTRCRRRASPRRGASRWTP